MALIGALYRISLLALSIGPPPRLYVLDDWPYMLLCLFAKEGGEPCGFILERLLSNDDLTQGAIVRSGTLAARSSRTRRYNRHWFILKDAVLAWYPSASVSFVLIHHSVETRLLKRTAYILMAFRIPTSLMDMSICEYFCLAIFEHYSNKRSRADTIAPRSRPLQSTTPTSKSQRLTRSGTSARTVKLVGMSGSRSSRRSCSSARTRVKVSR